jgi:hypothetical protein
VLLIARMRLLKATPVGMQGSDQPARSDRKGETGKHHDQIRSQ